MVDFFKTVKGQFSEDRQFTSIINDNKYDTNTGAIVDLALGLGCEYLNLKGFFRPEKIAKVFRYAEIAEE
jgi:enolase